VLVLPRTTVQISKSIRDSVGNSNSSLQSNVYSRHERVLLAWLNHHYKLQRDTLFETGMIMLHVHPNLVKLWLIQILHWEMC